MGKAARHATQSKESATGYGAREDDEGRHWRAWSRPQILQTSLSDTKAASGSHVPGTSSSSSSPKQDSRLGTTQEAVSFTTDFYYPTLHLELKNYKKSDMWPADSR
jgi:hypothetical protein